MKKILFVTDLDNTLIHSLRHRREGDVCVEMIHEKEQGYMSREAIELLQSLVRRVTIVPVTTRSIAQYQRIRWPEGCTPRFAAATNGAVLLDGDSPDPAWHADAAAFTAPLLDDMRALVDVLAATGDFIRVRLVDDAYVFVYCRDGVDPKAVAASHRADERFSCLASGKKVYFFPKPLDKGRAARKLREMMGCDLLVCAGDSVIDLPMLDAADVALVPGYGLPVTGCPDVRLCPGEDFAAALLRQLEQIATS